jgi:hypothetical protein
MSNLYDKSNISFKISPFKGERLEIPGFNPGPTFHIQRLYQPSYPDMDKSNTSSVRK